MELDLITENLEPTYTYSRSVANILFKGSKVPSLNLLVRDIFLNLRKFHIRLIPVWLNRENSEIQLADRGSREYRSDDYSLSSSCLAKILSNFPQVSVDAMASSTNAVSRTIFSR